jgi:RNA polymerase sigma-70 factor (ECF subfamily)
MRAIAIAPTGAAREIELADRRADAEERLVGLARAQLDRLYRLAGLLLGDSAEAEDATQEALLRAWRAASTLRDLNEASSWLDRILVNVCRDRLRRRRTIRFIPLADHGGGPDTDPFQTVLDRDEVLRAMAHLDPDQRIVVVLHYWAGLTLDGVAERVGWPVGTVKSRLHRALERMRIGHAAPVREAGEPR